jgi:RsmE family RNA methyltransferase
MNYLLLFKDEVSIDSSSATLNNERAYYAYKTHQIREGQKIKCGVLEGLLGEAIVLKSSKEKISLALKLAEEPPSREPFVLLVGLSRPQTIKKVLAIATMFGVSELHIVRSASSQKSYLDSGLLKAEVLRGEAIKALQQVGDTIIPKIVFHRDFMKFCQESFYPICERNNNPSLIVANPGSKIKTASLRLASKEVLLAVGSEGGWSTEELSKFNELGFLDVTMGKRILRTETALTALLSQIILLHSA